mmetsp:Transcript_29389/g.62545  ORF Transcript_29389/g.62545 Transcript_29389/m.62545 type:complete len:231 (+) Transcript_29389:202-894(+)
MPVDVIVPTTLGPPRAHGIGSQTADLLAVLPRNNAILGAMDDEDRARHCRDLLGVVEEIRLLHGARQVRRQASAQHGEQRALQHDARHAWLLHGQVHRGPCAEGPAHQHQAVFLHALFQEISEASERRATASRLAAYPAAEAVAMVVIPQHIHIQLLGHSLQCVPHILEVLRIRMRVEDCDRCSTVQVQRRHFWRICSAARCPWHRHKHEPGFRPQRPKLALGAWGWQES